MPRTWRIPPHDRAVVARISREMPCSPLLATVLAARGLRTGDEARSFIRADINDLHDPDLLPGIPEAADRVISAVRAGRRITIYGDYDVDGVTATSILWHCLKLAGARVDYYIPCRMEEGYGLNQEALRQLHNEDPQRLVITVDCGIASLAETQLARELGLELIVTDHHTFAASLPEAACCVHPRLPGSRYPFGDLCGAGVAFKLAWAVCKRLGEGGRATPSMREFLKSAVGLAALGTVADVVPLVGENRVLVRFGLHALKQLPLTGMKTLLQVAGLQDKQTLVTEDIGFALAPRINAAGRLGQARLAVELLTTDNPQRAQQLAEYVDELNRSRQSVERKMFKQARELVDEQDAWRDHRTLVLAHNEFHPGVVGIVAGRIAEYFERPAIVIALDDQRRTGQGSGRTFGAFDLHAALTACAEHLDGYGGHKAAAGLRIQESRIDPFREALTGYAAGLQSSSSGLDSPPLHVDAEVQLADLTHRAVRELDSLGPFGCDHRRACFVARGLELAEEPRCIGGGERHLSLKVRQGGRVLRCVAFGRAEWSHELTRAGGRLAFCFSAALNSFQGYDSVELHLHDWQPDIVPLACAQ
jgi:single-stranded-DNA-specific exonuclease